MSYLARYLNVLCLSLVMFLGCGLSFAAPQFPALTGRVVDNAHLLTPQSQHSLETSLEQYENGTTNQVVVVTLPDLNGYAIDDYGYQLGRHWQIGQKDKNNGVILIVAPKERKVRIEVGYGLEGTLTDLLSNQIIQNVILPSFKKGDYQKGILDGTQSIIDVLGGGKVARTPESQDNWVGWLFLILFILFIHHAFRSLISSGSGRHYGGGSGGMSGGGSSSDSDSGGFSGGGGSFGGGGSSGSW